MSQPTREQVAQAIHSTCYEGVIGATAHDKADLQAADAVIALYESAVPAVPDGDLAELLAKHHHRYDDHDWALSYGCAAGDWEPKNTTWRDEYHHEHAAHLADVLRAHGYGKRLMVFADVARISDRLDSDLSHHGTVFLDHLRVSKLTEETGEAYSALLGYQGVNPRKGVTHALDEVVTELADVVVTALGAMHHFIGDDAAGVVEARASFVADRLCGARALGVEVTDG